MSTGKKKFRVETFVKQCRAGQDRIFETRDLSFHCRTFTSSFPEVKDCLEELNKLIVEKESTPIQLYFVLDGHGPGMEVVNLAHELIPLLLYMSPKFQKGEYKEAIQEAVYKTHQLILKSDSNHRANHSHISGSGSTVSLALVTETSIYLAYAGDSPIVVQFAGSDNIHEVTYPGQSVSNPIFKQHLIESKISRIQEGYYGMIYLPRNSDTLEFERIGTGVNVFGGIGDAANDAEIVNELLVWIKKWQLDANWHLGHTVNGTYTDGKDWKWNSETQTAVGVSYLSALGNFGKWLLQNYPNDLRKSSIYKHFGILDKNCNPIENAPVDFISYYLLDGEFEIMTKNAMIRIPEVIEYKKDSIKAFAIMSDGVYSSGTKIEQFQKLFDSSDFKTAFELFNSMWAFPESDDRCGILYFL